MSGIRPEDKIPWKLILIIITFILTLIIRGMDEGAAYKTAARFFRVPEDLLRRIFKAGSQK